MGMACSSNLLENMKLMQEVFYSSFKVWRLTGELVYEYKAGENQALWQVLWRPGSYERGQKAPIKGEDGSASGKRKKSQYLTPNHLFPK